MVFIGQLVSEKLQCKSAIIQCDSLTCSSPPEQAEALRACGGDFEATVAPWPVSAALQTERA